MDKLNKYLYKITKQHNGKIVYSQRSTYYHIGGRIIRVSDHIGKSSDGSISFIYDAACSDKFIIYAKASGYVSVASYENVKKIIKAFSIMPALIGILETASNAPKDEIINKQTINKPTINKSEPSLQINNKQKEYILGYETSIFTENQLIEIKNMIIKNKKNIKNKKKKAKTMKLPAGINFS